MLSALAVWMSGDGPRIDSLHLGHPCALNRAFEKPVEDSKSAVGRVHDSDASFARLAALLQHQSMVADNLTGQDRDRRMKTPGLDLSLYPAWLVEVWVAVAEPVVGVEQARDGLNIAQLCVVDLNLIGGRFALSAFARELREGDELFGHYALRFYGSAESLAFAAEVHQSQVMRDRFDLSQFGRRSVKTTTEGCDRFAPVLDRAADRALGQFELHNQLTCRVAWIGALDDPSRKPVNNLPEPLGIRCFEPTSKREALNDAIHKDQLAGLTADRYPHAVGHLRRVRKK